MMSKALTQLTILNKFLSVCPMFDVTLDAGGGGDGVVVTVSSKALRMGTRAALVVVRMIGGFIVLVAGEAIVRLVDVMISALVLAWTC